MTGAAVIAMMSDAYAALATGVAMLDRWQIRGRALLYGTVFNVDPQVVMAVVHQESGGNPAHYVGDTGSTHGPSIGPMQVSRDTAKAYGLWSAPTDGSDERAAYQALSQDEDTGMRWGVQVLKRKLDENDQDEEAAVVAYNGSGAAAQAYGDAVNEFLSNTYPA